MSSTMIERMAQAALSRLQAAGADARALAAAQSLQSRGRALREGFFLTLDRHLSRALSEHAAWRLAQAEAATTSDPDGPPPMPAAAPAPSSGPEAERLAQALAPQVQPAWSALQQQMRSAGAEAPEALNPLRPQVFCDALCELLAATAPTPGEQRRWLDAMLPAAADELRAFYAQCGPWFEAAARTAAQAERAPAFSLNLRRAPAAAPRPARDGAAKTPAPAAPPAAGGPLPRPAPAPQRLRERLSDKAARVFPRMSDLASLDGCVPRRVLQAFLYEPDWIDRFDAPLPPSYRSALQATASALSSQQPVAEPSADERTQAQQARRALAPPDRPPLPLGADSWLDPEIWGASANPALRRAALLHTKQRAEMIGQALGLESVHATVLQLAGDTALLPPVREAVLALEPALLRLALLEPRFLASASHPARTLLEMLAQRSLEYNDEFSPAFEQFFAPARTVLQVLTDPDRDGAASFMLACEGLLETWNAEAGQVAEQHASQLRALQFVDQRQQLAKQIGRELARLPGLLAVPRSVQAFVLKIWPLVVAHAALTGRRDQVDPGGFRVAAGDLLWCAQPDHTPADVARLTPLLALLPQTLHDGLAMIGRAPVSAEPVLTVLAERQAMVQQWQIQQAAARQAHEQRLAASVHAAEAIEAAAAAEAQRASAPLLTTLAPPAAGAASHAEAELVPHPASQSDDTGVDSLADIGLTTDLAPWLNSTEADAVGLRHASGAEATAPAPGYELTGPGAGLPADQPSTVQPAAAPASHKPAADGEAPAPAPLDLRTLQTGARLDLYADGAWTRARLRWTNPPRTLFMFVAPNGQSYTMTRRSCEKLVAAGHLRRSQGRDATASDPAPLTALGSTTR